VDFRKIPLRIINSNFIKWKEHYLTDTEFASIENKEFTIERLKWVRDLLYLAVIPAWLKTAKEGVEDFKNSRKQLNGQKWIKKNLRILTGT
jgi:hypothetical protein